VFLVFAISCSGDTFRDLMLTAHALGMTNGDYVFFLARLFSGDNVGDHTMIRGDGLDEVLVLFL
jgi:hypothetical protein